MQQSENELITKFLEEEQLPDAFVQILTRWYLPLVRRILAMQKNRTGPLIVGINGAQGTGKSTLAEFLTLILSQHQLRVANLSLDDFYLDRKHRGHLARSVHPLLATRGVPGTHDVELMSNVLTELANPRSHGQLLLPRFDKAIDDPKPRSQWDSVELPVQVVLLEGWFVGLQAQDQHSLDISVNELENQEDSSGTWRHYVNEQLADYQSLFDHIDYLVMLKAPSFDCVYQWRSLQEQKLAHFAGKAGDKVMDQTALDRFIQHFERLTRHCLESLPGQADLVFYLNPDHQIVNSEPVLH